VAPGCWAPAGCCASAGSARAGGCAVRGAEGGTGSAGGIRSGGTPRCAGESCSGQPARVSARRTAARQFMRDGLHDPRRDGNRRGREVRPKKERAGLGARPLVGSQWSAEPRSYSAAGSPPSAFASAAGFFATLPAFARFAARFSVGSAFFASTFGAGSAFFGAGAAGCAA
jgi:hypothetical protein